MNKNNIKLIKESKIKYMF